MSRIENEKSMKFYTFLVSSEEIISTFKMSGSTYQYENVTEVYEYLKCQEVYQYLKCQEVYHSSRSVLSYKCITI